MITEYQVCDVRITETPCHNSVTGYGRKVPTRYMMKIKGHGWRRVYCRIFSNIGPLYVLLKKEEHLLSIGAEDILQEIRLQEIRLLNE